MRCLLEFGVREIEAQEKSSELSCQQSPLLIQAQNSVRIFKTARLLQLAELVHAFYFLDRGEEVVGIIGSYWVSIYEEANILNTI